MHTDRRNKNILVHGEGPTQGLDKTKITAETKYTINFTESGKNLAEVCIIMEAIVFYFLMQ